MKELTRPMLKSVQGGGRACPGFASCPENICFGHILLNNL